MKKKAADNEFYGATTIGSKGQIVIPCDARKVLKLKEGDKLLAFIIENALVFSKLEGFESFAAKATAQIRQNKKMKSVRTIA